MNCFVTGAEGFIGSHLVENLVRNGDRVKALCLYNSFSNIGWLSQLPNEIGAEIEIIFGDVNDTELMFHEMNGQDKVFNLAALIAIPYSYRAPRSYYQTNIFGTLNIIEAAKKHNCHLIQISTSEVYGTPDTVPITENHKLKPQSPYAASKSAADFLVLAHNAAFGVPVTVVRPFNTYGPRQSQRAIIPTILAQFISKRQKIILGNLTTKRDFTFVSDTVSGIIDASMSIDLLGDVVQLGSGEVVSVSDIVSMVSQLTGQIVEVVQDQDRVRPSGSEISILHSDPTKAREAFGWSPKTSFKDGLSVTLDWMKENISMLRRVDHYHT
jgi:UDP-glucose 4-epimerase